MSTLWSVYDYDSTEVSVRCEESDGLFSLFGWGVLGLGFLSSLPLQPTLLVCYTQFHVHVYTPKGTQLGYVVM